MRLYLIRHPRPAIGEGICYGASEVDLIEDVSQSAVRLQDRLPGHLQLFSSPLRRCRALAEALHRQPRFDARLQELNFGDWEGKPWDEIPREQIDAWAAAPWTFAPPNGESVERLRSRVDAFLSDRGWPDGEDIAVVTHNGVMQMMSTIVTGSLDPPNLTASFTYGELHVLDSLMPAGLSRTDC